jgi:hypothetical protein
MNLLRFSFQKLSYSPWTAIFLVVLMFACDDDYQKDGPKIIKFSGQVFGKNAAGQTAVLANCPVDISFYEEYPLPVLNPTEVPIIVRVMTDAEGKYILPVVDGVYKGYSITDGHVYYGTCSGMVGPMGFPAVLPVESENVNNLSLCIASLFVIEKNRDAGSTNTLHLSYKAKIDPSTVIITSSYEITEFPVTEIRFFPAIIEVEFTILIKNNGETIETITETHTPVPGSTSVIDVDF